MKAAIPEETLVIAVFSVDVLKRIIYIPSVQRI